MPLSPQQKEAFARANTSTVYWWSVELRHPTFTAPIRVAESKTDIDLLLEASAPVDSNTTQTFTGLGLVVKEPDISTDPDSTLTIQADGVSGALQPYMAAANKTSVPVEVTLRPFSYNVMSGEIGEMLGVFHLQVRHTQYTKTTVTMQVGYTNSANRAFPAINYTADSHPGLL